jgi:hypothetical protein
MNVSQNSVPSVEEPAAYIGVVSRQQRRDTMANSFFK